MSGTHHHSPDFAPCGASWHGRREGSPDCGCGWGSLCTLKESPAPGPMQLASIRTAYPAPIAYTYMAAHHCPDCAAKAFGVDAEGWIPETAVDGEGNGIGALAPWDEWEEYGEEFPQVLSCDTCGREIARCEG